MPATERPHVRLYTDGACAPNPGPGGWAFILDHPKTGTRKEDSGGERDTTNNRMELMGVIRGLETLKRACRVEVYSDSKYVLNGLEKWMSGWKAKGWVTAGKTPVKNVDLWKALDALKATHSLSFHWVAGHSGHPENDRCDELAVAARLHLGR